MKLATCLIAMGVVTGAVCGAPSEAYAATKGAPKAAAAAGYEHPDPRVQASMAGLEQQAKKCNGVAAMKLAEAYEASAATKRHYAVLAGVWYTLAQTAFDGTIGKTPKDPAKKKICGERVRHLIRTGQLSPVDLARNAGIPMSYIVDSTVGNASSRDDANARLDRIKAGHLD